MGKMTASKETRNRFQLPRASRRPHQKRWALIISQFAILFALWLVLLGHYHARFIITGAVLAALVTLYTNDLFSSLFESSQREEANARSTLVQIGHFLTYIPWLISRIVLANLQVAYIVLHPRMPIDPVFLQFRTRMKRGISQVTLANSITLTPGTLTTNLKDGKYTIHCLVPSAASEILKARMQNKIAPIFDEEKEKPPETAWKYSVEELS